MISHRRKGLLFILVGPTGAGKNTIMNEVLDRIDGLTQLPTATTRGIRQNEREGREHFFLTVEEFNVLIEQDGLLEHQNVHGRLYGVPRHTVAQAIDAEQDRIADIDVLGAMNVRAAFPDNTLLIFVQPGASDNILATVRERLEQREEKPEEIERRLKRVPLEMSYAPLCDYLIINEDLHTAIDTLQAIIVAERSRRDLLNLRVRNDHPRHRLFQTSAMLVLRGEQVLLADDIIPQAAIAPGEYPIETAARALPEGVTTQPSIFIGITTHDEDHYDQLTFWYAAIETGNPVLPGNTTWQSLDETNLPTEIRNQIRRFSYSE